METAAIQEIKNITPEEIESSELQPPLFSLVFEDVTSVPGKEQLTELLEENGTGIENKVKKAVLHDKDKDNDEEEEYTKSVTYDTENSYIQKNPYAPKKNYERVEEIKPKEEEESKSFLSK